MLANSKIVSVTHVE